MVERIVEGHTAVVPTVSNRHAVVVRTVGHDGRHKSEPILGGVSRAVGPKTAVHRFFSCKYTYMHAGMHACMHA